jgi:hypothetical protein
VIVRGIVGITVGVPVGVADTDGVLLAAWLLLVEDVQPAIDNEAIKTSMMMAISFFVTYVASMLGLSVGTGMIVALRLYLSSRA